MNYSTIFFYPFVNNFCKITVPDIFNMVNLSTFLLNNQIFYLKSSRHTFLKSIPEHLYFYENYAKVRVVTTFLVWKILAL